LLKSMFQNANAEHQTWPSPNRSTSNMSNLDVSNQKKLTGWSSVSLWGSDNSTAGIDIYPTRWCK
jgi:hypothetical protein